MATAPLPADDYVQTHVTPDFTHDGCVITYKDIAEKDRGRIIETLTEHAKVYDALGFRTIWAKPRPTQDDFTFGVKFGRHKISRALFEIFKGMIMATVVKTSWGGPGSLVFLIVSAISAVFGGMPSA